MSPEALTELINEHSLHMRRWVAKKLFYYPYDVDDVLQHAFLKMVKAADKISDDRVRARMSLWQAVRWSVQDYFRDRYGLPNFEEIKTYRDAAATNHHYVDNAGENLGISRILDAVNRLPEKQRQMILSVIREEGKPEGVGQSTYHAHLHHARKNLREMLKHVGVQVS